MRSAHLPPTAKCRLPTRNRQIHSAITPTSSAMKTGAMIANFYRRCTLLVATHRFEKMSHNHPNLIIAVVLIGVAKVLVTLSPGKMEHREMSFALEYNLLGASSAYPRPYNRQVWMKTLLTYCSAFDELRSSIPRMAKPEINETRRTKRGTSHCVLDSCREYCSAASCSCSCDPQAFKAACAAT